MNEKEFTQQLDIIAEEETPENFNIWDSIKMELQEDKPKKQKRAPSKYPWLRYAAGLVICIGLGIAGYIYFNPPVQSVHSSSSDPSLPADLITNLSLSQTVEGVTISVDWAYADAHRATISMTTSYMSDVPFDPYCATCTSTMSIKTSDGQEVPPAFGGGGGGGGGGPYTGPYLISSSSSASYDTSGLVVTDGTLDLIITLSYDPQGQPAAGTEGTGGGGGGGGGGSSDSIEAEMTPSLNPALVPVRNYQFAFSIPFYPERTGILESPMLDSNNIHFELSNLAITPSITSFDLCYSLPTAEEWYPNILIYTGTEIVIYEPLVDLAGRIVYLAYSKSDENYMPIISFDYEAMQACGSFIAQAPYEAGDIEIMIPYLYLGTFYPAFSDNSIAAEQAYFAELGIEFIHSITTDVENLKAGQEGTYMFPVSENPDDGYNLIVITRHPNSMTATEAISYVMSNWMRERHQTDINYRVHIP